MIADDVLALKTLATQRQRDVSWLLRWGVSDKEMARLLGTSPETIKIHVKGATRIARIKNRTQLAVMSCRAWGFPVGNPPLDGGPNWHAPVARLTEDAYEVLSDE